MNDISRTSLQLNIVLCGALYCIIKAGDNLRNLNRISKFANVSEIFLKIVHPSTAVKKIHFVAYSARLTIDGPLSLARLYFASLLFSVFTGKFCHSKF